jgi:hypothetical protein
MMAERSTGLPTPFRESVTGITTQMACHLSCRKARRAAPAAAANCRQVQQFTRNDLEQHLESHRRGTACATTRVASKRGIGFTLVGTWTGSPEMKREVKSRGVVGQCAVCQTHPAVTLPHPA